jgi:glutaredoxin 3
MADITIYISPVCPYCTRAKSLLKDKGYDEYQEIDISTDASIREEMMEKAGGRRTVPQIFINGTHVGGFDDMYAMDKEGKLDALLAG